MKILILILSIIIGFKTVYYGIFEIKENNNKFGGIVVICLAIIALIAPNVVMYL